MFNCQEQKDMLSASSAACSGCSQRKDWCEQVTSQ